jgi:hypothetical protein
MLAVIPAALKPSALTALALVTALCRRDGAAER